MKGGRVKGAAAAGSGSAAGNGQVQRSGGINQGQRGHCAAFIMHPTSPPGSSLRVVPHCARALCTLCHALLQVRAAGGGLLHALSLTVSVHSVPCVTHYCRYVQQEVVLPGTSTVWEYLTFHASLRLPASTPPSQIRARAEAVSDQLGLAKVRMGRGMVLYHA